MTDVICLIPKQQSEIECLCFDQEPCDIHINDGGHLICRNGSNEYVIDGIARVICPLEIASEREKWEAFLAKEAMENEIAKKKGAKK